MRQRVYRLLLVTILAMVSPVLAGDVRCSQCKREISGNYVKSSDGRPFCSRRCFKQSLPKCAVCKKPLSGKYYPHEGKKYCSEKCLSVLFPACEFCGAKIKEWTTVNGHTFCSKCAARERCAECRLPFKQAVKFKDGRHLCLSCRKTAVLDLRRAKTLFLESRRELEQMVGRKLPKEPSLQMVGLDQLYKVMDREKPESERGILRGFYQRNERTTIRGNERKTQVRETVYLLYGMTEANVRVTAVHENTHDFMADFFPTSRDAPGWLQEGVAQYMAATFARKHRFDDKLERIEKHPNPDYGGGYRYFKKKFGDNNLRGVLAWLSSTDLARLPEKCPVK